MSFCPQCGKPTAPGASFCTACGATLPAGAPTTPAIAAPAPSAAPQAIARVRPVGVTIIGIVLVVGSAFFALAMLIGMMFVATGAAWWTQFSREWIPYLPDFGPIAMAVVFTMMLIAAGVAALGIATGIGVLNGRDWAWGLTLVLMALNGLSGLFDLATLEPGGVVAIAVSGLVIWYFFQPDVKRWFGRA